MIYANTNQTASEIIQTCDTFIQDFNIALDNYFLATSNAERMVKDIYILTHKDSGLLKEKMREAIIRAVPDDI